MEQEAVKPSTLVQPLVDGRVSELHSTTTWLTGEEADQEDEDQEG